MCRNVSNVWNVENVSNVSNVTNLANLESAENVSNNSNVENVSNVRNVENVGNVSNVRNARPSMDPGGLHCFLLDGAPCAQQKLSTGSDPSCSSSSSMALKPALPQYRPPALRPIFS